MSKQPKLATLSIHQFSNEGFGQANWQKSEDNQVSVEIPFTAPGDEVEVELFKNRQGHYQGRIQQWIHQNPNRVKPRCKHFGACGGCRLQHVDEGTQLEIKENLVRQLLTPYLSSNAQWHPIVACSPPWNYRNKMEFTFSSDKYNHHYLGLILLGSRGHVFQLEECHITEQWVADTVRVVSSWWQESGLKSYHSRNNTGSLRTLTLRSGFRTGDRMVMLTVSGNPDYAINKQQLKILIDSLKSAVSPMESSQQLSIVLRIQQIAKGQPTQFYEMILSGPDHLRENLTLKMPDQTDQLLNFRISPTAFFQPNTVQAERLYAKAIHLAQVSKDSLVYDLYCGTGTLSICLSKFAREVRGIELSPESVIDARENIKLNQIDNLTIYQGDVGKTLADWSHDAANRPDCVFVDPPRSGLDPQAIHHLLALNPPTLCYISCNPVTQAANIDLFIQAGYFVAAVQPVDQFPQTIHVENIVILKR